MGATTLIVDSSALVAILREEPEAAVFRDSIGRNVTKVSVVSMLETSIVVKSHRHEDVDQLLRDGEIAIIPFDADHARVAREAYARYGKKSGSSARLNFGDCMTYALAKITGEPLLFKGDDFTHTDLESAL